VTQDTARSLDPFATLLGVTIALAVLLSIFAVTFADVAWSEGDTATAVIRLLAGVAFAGAAVLAVALLRDSR
jgi:hypothetical protein